MKTRRRIVVIILVIVGIWVAAIATHYVSVAWYRSKFAAKWEKPLAQEYEKSRKQAEERFYALLEYYDKKYEVLQAHLTWSCYITDVDTSHWYKLIKIRHGWEQACTWDYHFDVGRDRTPKPDNLGKPPFRDKLVDLTTWKELPRHKDEFGIGLVKPDEHVVIHIGNPPKEPYYHIHYFNNFSSRKMPCGIGPFCPCPIGDKPIEPTEE